MDKTYTVRLCDLPSDPVLLAKELDRLIPEGRYVQIDDVVYDDAPKSIRFSSSEREMYILDSYMQELAHIPQMSNDALNSIFRSGSKSQRLSARDSALHIVPAIVELYASPIYMDMLQIGNAELLDAAEQYDADKYDFDFTSFAAVRIRHGILGFLNEQSNIHYSDRQIEAASEKAAEMYRQYLSENGVPPMAEELAEQVGIDVGFAHVICEQLNNR